MQNWDRPPPDIAVAELFERWLPEAFAAAGHRAPAGAPTVRVSISGAGGGTWEVRADDTTLSVGPASKEPPDIWIRQSVGDLRVALGAPDADLPVLLPAGWSARDLLFARSARRRSGASDSRGGWPSRSRAAGGGAGSWTSVSARRASARAGRERPCASTARRSRACARARSRRCRRCSTAG